MPKESIKDRSAYWKDRIKKQTNGQFAVQIQFDGKRRFFALRTGNQATASEKARDIFINIRDNGWEATEEHLRPNKTHKDAPTLGDVFEALKTVSTIKASTLADYARAARNIVSGIRGIDKDNKRYDAKGGNAQWKAKVDAIKLTDFTAADVRQWRDAFINGRAKGDPDSKEGITAKVSSNSLMRQARSLFGKGCLSKLKDKGLRLPSPLPFHDDDEHQNRIISKIDPKRLRFKSTVNFEELVVDAAAELGGDPEKQNQWLIFLLCGLAGLRRNEADKLLWSQVDATKKIITIENTEYFTAKTASSEDDVDIDDELSAILQGFKARSESQFVLTSSREVDLSRRDRNYRCEEDFQLLIKWLRTKGVTERKAIHCLRKEIASHLYKDQGIDAASKFLRHSETGTTQRFYADPNKRKQTSGLGHLLTKPQNVEDLIKRKKA